MLRLLMMLALVGPFAAAPAAAPPAGAVESEIRAMEKRWNDARVKADVAALDRMLAADWTVTHGDGTINTKAEYLADLKSGVR